MFSRVIYSHNTLLNTKRCISKIPKEYIIYIFSILSFSFDNYVTIMDKEPVSRLINGLFVFTLCENKPLVKNASDILKYANHFPGKSITNIVLKHTIFSRFCGGEKYVIIIYLK